MILPHGSRVKIAERAGIKKQHVMRSLQAGNPVTKQAAIQVVREMLEEKKATRRELETLTAELDSLKVPEPRRRRKSAKPTQTARWYTVQETAQALNLSPDTVIRRMKGDTSVKWPSHLVNMQARPYRIHEDIIKRGGK